MTIRTFDARIKTKDDGADGTEAGQTDGTEADGGGGKAGQFEALVSVFDNRDSYGDVIRKGAFAGTLAAWQEKGLPIPIYYSHRLDDPDMNIGHVVSAEETDRGLHIVGQLDLGMPKAETVYRLFKAGRLSQFSFSYSVLDGSVETDPATDQEFNELRELDLYEVGPTPVGANSETELMAVKDARYVAEDIARRVKAGKVLSAANLNALVSARDAIDGVITSAQTEAASGAGKSVKDGTGSSKAEEPARVKAEDSARRASLSDSGIGQPSSSASALNALLLLDIRSLDHANHQRTA